MVLSQGGAGFALALVVKAGSVIVSQTVLAMPCRWVLTKTKQLSMAATVGGDMVVRIRKVLAIPWSLARQCVLQFISWSNYHRAWVTCALVGNKWFPNDVRIKKARREVKSNFKLLTCPSFAKCQQVKAPLSFDIEISSNCTWRSVLVGIMFDSK